MNNIPERETNFLFFLPVYFRVIVSFLVKSLLCRRSFDFYGTAVDFYRKSDKTIEKVP